jgi:hypothetical protein
MSTFDDREDRPSWSEIDKRKDRSKHLRTDSPDVKHKPSVQEEWAKKQYLKEIDKLFTGKREEPEDQKKARKAIAQHYGSSKFNSTVNQYIKKFDVPRDWGTLILMLDHKDVKIVMKTLDVLRELVHESSAAEKEGFKSRVKIVAMTTDNEALQERAEELLQEL